VLAARSGDSDLELTQLQKGRVSFVMFMIIIVTYMMKDEVIYGGGFELSMMEQQQIFICISDALFFNPRAYGCCLPLVTTSFFGGARSMFTSFNTFFGFILICYVGSWT